MHKCYITLGGFVSSVIGYLAMISNPYMSIRYWSEVISTASSVNLGQFNAPISSFLWQRRKPSSSQMSALIRSHFFRKSHFFMKKTISHHHIQVLAFLANNHLIQVLVFLSHIPFEPRNNVLELILHYLHCL